MNKSIYIQLNSLTKEYFDSSSRAFIDDLIEYHLHIEPRKIKLTDLTVIIDWLEIAAQLLLSNQRNAKAYIVKVRHLMEVE